MAESMQERQTADRPAVLPEGGAAPAPAKKPKHKMLATTKKAHIFCACVLAFMLVQWCIFFLYGNFNSILLAFQYYDPDGVGQQVFYPVGEMFTNFGDFITDLFLATNRPLGRYFLNGMVYHLTGLICLPISLIFAFIIYKEMLGAGFMKVVLFIPSIISAMVIALLFKTFMTEGLFGIWKSLQKPYDQFLSPLADDSKVFLTLILYQFFFGLPGSLLINIGTMSRTPKELIEFGEMEGMSYFQEFRYITLPLMFPVLQIYCLGMFTGFFTAQGPLYAIYGDGASGTSLPDSAISFGYYMMVSVISDNFQPGIAADFMYGYTAAANLLIGLVSIPIVYGTKKLFDRFDPEADF